MEKVKIALIGYGNRGRLYSSFIKDNLDKIDYVAIVDYRAKEIENDIKNNTNVKYIFSSDEELFNAKLNIDLVLICSMDKYHFAQAKKCLQNGYNILIEKPISANIDEVNELNELASKKKLKVVVTYVLRYTLFYRRIKEIIISKKIGDIVNINTTENVAYWHQAHSYTRGNWKDSKETGPMILTKCSHDMDLIYWLMGKEVKRISSFGNRNYLKEENAPKDSSLYCTDCKCKETCAFNCYKFYLSNKEWLRPMVGDDLSDENILKYLDHSQYSRCVFKCNSDVVDHQIINFEFADNSTASHTMNAYTRYCYRDIKIMGTKGCIEGNFEEKKFKVYYFLNDEEETIDISKYTADFVGHGGGDRIMFLELIDYLLYNKKSIYLTSIQESVISHKMAFAAEKSRLEHGKVITL